MAAFHEPISADSSPEEVQSRRRRFKRSVAAPAALTPLKLTALAYLLDYRFLLVPQLARLMDCSDQAARRHLRELYDAGYVEKIAVPRAALVDGDVANDPSLTYGSAPPIHCLSKQGIKALIDANLTEQQSLKAASIHFGPRNAMFLRHEIFVRNIRIWLATVRLDGFSLRSWRDAIDCEIRLPAAPTLRPDGIFTLDIGERAGRAAVLAGFIEADRGTERGPTRWAEKIKAYATLFANDKILVATTGFRYARVLVITRSETRRDWIWEMIEQTAANLMDNYALEERFWIADHHALSNNQLAAKCWRIPSIDGLSRLIDY